MSKTKKFDCVEMKRKAHERMVEETKNMTSEERHRHFQKQIESSPLGEQWNRLKARQGKGKKAAS
jgi:hypothetical protein